MGITLISRLQAISLQKDNVLAICKTTGSEDPAKNSNLGSLYGRFHPIPSAPPVSSCIQICEPSTSRSFGIWSNSNVRSDPSERYVSESLDW